MTTREEIEKIALAIEAGHDLPDIHLYLFKLALEMDRLECLVAENEALRRGTSSLIPSASVRGWIAVWAAGAKDRLSHVMDPVGRQAIDEIRAIEEWLSRFEEDHNG
jgi:hypothetical protein